MAYLKPRTATVPLYQGDDMDELSLLARRLDQAKRRLKIAKAEAAVENTRAGDDSESVASAQAVVDQEQDAYDEFVDGAADRALEVELRSIGRRRFRDLLVAHPPRRIKRTIDAPRALGDETAGTVDTAEEVDHPDDISWGVNVETFPEALLTFFDDSEVSGDEEPVMTIGAPSLPTTAARKRFVDNDLAEGDFDRLWQTAYFLNRAPSSDPKELASMSASQSSDET